jgi:hypothetical protein
MSPTVRQNERSWAIEIISEINIILHRLSLQIKRAGGESTLSENRKSMFPDVLLYADEARTTILQGWELKMPDVSITDQAFIDDATRKARVLSLNSFVIWNFTYGKLYIKGDDGNFTLAKTWDGTSHIRTREDVNTLKDEWCPIIEEIVTTVNQFITTGEIAPASLIDILSDNIMTAIIGRNKSTLSDYFRNMAAQDTTIEQRIKAWWRDYKEDYDDDEPNEYLAYAKNILLSWTNRIVFANIIKTYHCSANLVREIDLVSTPQSGSEVMQEIIRQGDYYNVFHGLPYDDLLPEDTWVDVVDFNQFLIENGVSAINHSVLQDLLEKTVSVAKRERRGQFATPKWLADFIAQITISDWSGDCADPCSGTGTIAKAIIDNKNLRLYDRANNFAKTWVSDKYAYPLQIANIALTDIDAINIPLNIFQSNAFSLHVGDTITIKSPVDGSDIQIQYPALDAIVTNLPFVPSNSIGTDEAKNIEEILESVRAQTALPLITGRMDLYMALPFKLHELLNERGRMGVILSNSWLGTESGRSFYNALNYYFNIRAVVMSGAGRWFDNADVVTTLLVLQKKEITAPNQDSNIQFCLTTKCMKEVTKDEYEQQVGSIVLQERVAENVPVALSQYKISEIESILSKGISLNALFHDVNWINEISSKLIPISDCLTIKRGERRGCDDLFYPAFGHGIEQEYIKSVLKSSTSLNGYDAQADTDAFCCGKTLAELRTLGHTGALNWISRFAGLNNGVGRPLPEVLKKSGCQWYEMKDTSRADFVTSLNPNKRLFIATFEEPAFVNQRLIALNLINGNKELVHALLNSVFEMFVIEATGFGRGLGALDLSADNFKKTYMLNPALVDANDANSIVDLFERIKERGVLDTEAELTSTEREEFDKAVLTALGIEEYHEQIKNSLLSMQKARLSVLN